MTMEDFLTKISILKDAIAATGEHLKESEIILITLGTLGDGYESFVTSVTMRYDHSMTFSGLCELLMDQEMRVQRSQSILNNLFVNVVTKFVPRGGFSQSKKAEIVCQICGCTTDLLCQICGRKCHSAVDCYNRLNLSRFPPHNKRELTPSGPTRSNQTTPHSANMMTVWYPDSGATSHITSSSLNVQRPRAFTGNDCILTVDGSPLPIFDCGKRWLSLRRIKLLASTIYSSSRILHEIYCQ